jgi:hypothetical protein
VLVDGTVRPTWDWRSVPDRSLAKVGCAGMNLQVAATVTWSPKQPARLGCRRQMKMSRRNLGLSTGCPVQELDHASGSRSR